MIKCPVKFVKSKFTKFPRRRTVFIILKSVLSGGCLNFKIRLRTGCEMFQKQHYLVKFAFSFSAFIEI